MARTNRVRCPICRRRTMLAGRDLCSGCRKRRSVAELNAITSTYTKSGAAPKANHLGADVRAPRVAAYAAMVAAGQPIAYLPPRGL